MCNEKNIKKDFIYYDKKWLEPILRTKFLKIRNSYDSYKYKKQNNPTYMGRNLKLGREIPLMNHRLFANKLWG